MMRVRCREEEIKDEADYKFYLGERATDADREETRDTDLAIEWRNLQWRLFP